MTKVGKSDCEGTVAGTRRDDEVAPKAVVGRNGRCNRATSDQLLGTKYVPILGFRDDAASYILAL